MGVAKAALEASVRYLAVDLGRNGVRVNAISAGPMRTISGTAVSNARFVYNWNRAHSALKRTPTLEEIGGAALYLLSDLSGAVTGEIHHVDAGYSIVGLPRAEDVKNTSTEGDSG
jgi:enoyl-[acyl-carrier protein] reductase I